MKRLSTLFVIGIFAAYVLLTLLFTYPVIIHVGTEAAGLGSDMHYTLSKILNNYARLRDLGYAGALWDTVKNVRVDPITIHTALYAIFGAPLGYNLSWMFSYIASGFGMYLLAKEVLEGSRLLRRFTPRNDNARVVSRGDDRRTVRSTDNSFRTYLTIQGAAFLAGVIYAFNPAHVAWSFGFAGSTHTEWIPLTTFFILRFVRRPRIVTAVALLFSLLLLIQGENHFAAFYALFLIVFLPFIFWNHRSVFKNRVFLFSSFAVLILAVAVGIFHYLPLLRIATSQENWLNPGQEQAIRYSNDLLSAVVPPFTHGVWGDFFEPIRSSFTGNEVDYSAYLGYTLIILIAMLLVHQRTREILFWTLAGVGFYILSLGPYLHVQGVIEPRIPLPYLLLYKAFPFFENIRAIDRISVSAYMCFAVVFAFAVAHIAERIRHPRRAALAIVGIGALLVTEYFSVPIPTTSLAYSPFYTMIRDEPGNFSILEIPSETNYRAAARSTYYQAIHQRPMINTFQFARSNPNDPIVQRNQEIPILKELLYELPHDAFPQAHSAIDTLNRQNNTAILSSFGIRYITLHKEFIGEGDREMPLEEYVYLRSFLEEAVSARKVFEDDTLAAYRLNDDLFPITPAPLLIEKNGWEPYQVDGGLAYQVVQTGAELTIRNIFHQEGATLQLFARGREGSVLRVDWGDGQSYRFALSKDFQRFRISSSLAQEDTRIQFVMETSEGGEDASAKAEITKISTDGMSKTRGVYEQILSKNDGSVLQIPFHGYSTTRTDEQERILSPRSLGMPEDLSPLDSVPLIGSALFYGSGEGEDSFSAHHDIFDDSFYASSISSFLARSGTKTIVLHTNLLSEKDVDAYRTMIEQYVPLISQSTQDDMIVYSIAPKEDSSQPWAHVGKNWDILERVGSVVQVRKMNEGAQIVVHNSSAHEISTTFAADIRTCSEGRQTLVATIDGKKVSEKEITWSEFAPVRFALMIANGEHEIRFQTSEPQSGTLAECPIWFSDVSITENS
ncbi:MAG: hypothetical protein HYV34_02835 [Candidatus Kerfeldbacteria bacterium]|nr:hypothetical protein [Candidatus Kerfeldbacteria bacterium]